MLPTREAPSEFQALADATPALIWVDAADRGRTLVNRAWLEFTGAGPRDDLGGGWRARVHPGDAERCAAVRTAAIAAGEPFELEYRLRRADGRYRWVLDRGAPLGDGTYVGGCLDIDDRHRERERRHLINAVGAAMDTETSVAARRDVFVRTLVDEGFVDLARLVDMADTPRTVAVAATRPEDADVLWGLDPPRRLDQSLIGAGGAQLITVDDAYLAGIAGGERQRAARAALGAHTSVAVPLRARGRMVGLLVTGRVGDSPRLEEDDAALLGEVAQRAAIALDNADLLATERATTRRLELLQQATAALSAAPSPRAVARAAVHQLRELLGTDAVAVWQRRDDDLMLLASAGFRTATEWARLPIALRTPFTDTARDGEPRFITSPDEGRRGYPETWPDVPGYPRLLMLPLRVARERLGAVAVGLPPGELAADDRAVALAIADQCAHALQRAGLLAAESLARRTAEGLADVVSALSGASTPAQVAAVITRHALALGASEAVVVLRAGDQVEVLAGPHSRARVPRDHPLVKAMDSGQPLWLGRSVDDGLPSDAVVPLLLDGHAIGAIGLAFAPSAPRMGPSQRAIIRTVAGQCAQALDRARLHAVEHEVAEVLQRSLLPRELPRLARLAVASRYLAGSADTQAGGDWYDLIPVDDHRVAVAVGDVVGHGPAAAAVMGQLRSALDVLPARRARPRRRAGTPRPVRRPHPGRAGQHLRLRHARLAVRRAALRPRRAPRPYCSSGRTAPATPRRAAGTVLAVVGRPPFAEGSATITPGTSVLLYTDGLVERRDEIVDEGLARLAAAAERHRAADPEVLADRVVEDVLGGTGPPDDVALVVVRLVPAPLAVTLPAVPASLRALRRAITAWATAAGLPDAAVDDLQLAAGEAAANAAEHAYPDTPGHVRRRRCGGRRPARSRCGCATAAGGGPPRPIPASGAAACR